MKKLPRREFLHLAVSAAALTLGPSCARALDYPTRPVHVVAGYPAGAGPDIIARLIAQALSESMGQQFIVDNRPGASSNIGTEIVAHAAPDIPAIAEFVPGYAAAGWYGICATTGTPDDIVVKLNAAISVAATDPGMKAKLLNLGVEPMTMPVSEFKKFVADEIAKYAKVINTTGMKVD